MQKNATERLGSTRLTTASQRKKSTLKSTNEKLDSKNKPRPRRTKPDRVSIIPTYKNALYWNLKSSRFFLAPQAKTTRRLQKSFYHLRFGFTEIYQRCIKQKKCSLLNRNHQVISLSLSPCPTSGSVLYVQLHR